MKKKIGIAIVTMTTLSALVGLTPVGAFGFFVHSNIYGYYSDSESSKQLNDIWISPMIAGKRSYFALPPIYVKEREVGPYQLGLKFVDYENKNKCQSVEITELVAIHQGIERDMLVGNRREFGPFQTYVSGVSHVSLEALVDVGDWLNEKNNEEVEIRATFRIICADEVIESSFSGKVKSTHIEGVATILDYLSA